MWETFTREVDTLIIVGDSIVSGINRKELSTENFKTIVCDIPGATSQDMVMMLALNHKINHKMLIIHVRTSKIANDINTIENFGKIYNYAKNHAKETELVFLRVCYRAEKKGIVSKVKSLNLQIADFCQSKNSKFIEHSTINNSKLFIKEKVTSKWLWYYSRQLHVQS